MGYMHNKELDIRKSIVIEAPISKVWEALIEPEIIKQYLFGTTAISDWKVGSDLVFKGEWDGKKYEDKGKILKLVPDRLLEYTHWSGIEEKPEPADTHIVSFELEELSDEKTKVTVSQDNNKDKESMKKSEQNWEFVLASMKKVLEK